MKINRARKREREEQKNNKEKRETMYDREKF
jgi:hypothetical protein